MEVQEEKYGGAWRSRPSVTES